MRPPRFTTGARIALALITLFACAFYYLFNKLQESVERQYLEAVEEPMVDAAHLFASVAELHLDAGGGIDAAPLRDAFSAAHGRRFEAQIWDLLKTRVGMHLYLTDAEGTVLFNSDAGTDEGADYSWRRDVSLTLKGGYGARSTRTDEADDDSSVMFVAAPIRHRGEIVGVASVSKPQAAVFAFRDDTERRIDLLLRGALATCLLGATFIVGWFLRPVRKLTTYARAIRRGHRVPVPKLASGEMRTLAAAFEEMRDTLEGRNYIETYVSSLTHEMKSPLSGIRGAAELLAEDGLPPGRRAKFLANIRAESDRLGHIIDRLLALSELEAKKSIDASGPVDLAELLQRVAADHAAALEAKDLHLQIDTAAGSSIEADAFLLEMAAANLLQNAIDFSPRGGRIDIATQRAGSSLKLHFDDRGPGVPDYARERAFDRFFSLVHPDTGRKSSGLGLCFVREAAELHGGSAALEPRPGGGTRATLTLPL